jgi:hypothetical protein
MVVLQDLDHQASTSNEWDLMGVEEGLTLSR